MGTALLGGLLDAGWAEPNQILVVETSTAQAEALAAKWPGIRVSASPEKAEGAILAVKPQVAAGVAHTMGELGVGRILSIAAGVRIATLEAALPKGCAVIRAMPNTPALVGSAATAIAPGTSASATDLAWAAELLGTVGKIVQTDERHLDAVTGLSGSGPAYVFLVAEAMIEAGVLNGLDRATSKALAVQTLLGSARLLAEDDAEAAELRAAVTSPGGTTAAGLAALEHAGVRAAILDAVTAATRRSTELG